jgi:hypothetical protein
MELTKDLGSIPALGDLIILTSKNKSITGKQKLESVLASLCCRISYNSGMKIIRWSHWIIARYEHGWVSSGSFAGVHIFSTLPASRSFPQYLTHGPFLSSKPVMVG